MTEPFEARHGAARPAAGPDVTKDLVGRVRRRLTQRAGAATPVAVLDAVRAEPAQAPLGGTTLLRLSDRLYDELAGAGPLGSLLADPTVTDIVVNGPAEVWVDRGAGMVRAPITFPDADSLRRLAQRLAASCERRLDDASPYVDAHLPGRDSAARGPATGSGPRAVPVPAHLPAPRVYRRRSEGGWHLDGRCGGASSRRSWRRGSRIW